MPEILFIKTSSLGDVVHHMAAVTEARRHCPAARFSWVVEEAYVPLVSLHPAVDRVIPVASRRWRRRVLEPATWREIGAFRRNLRATAYGVVIDTQGLLRTGLIARMARGTRHGYDRTSIREPGASFLYDVRHKVSRTLHAIDRNRILTGQSLGYAPEGPPDFGLGAMRGKAPTERTAVLLHGSARTEKQWPAEHWRSVAKALADQGFALVLPSGSAAELARSRTIAEGIPEARLLDRQPLDAVAREIAGAGVVVGVDTGLLHLAAALSVPLVAIFTGGSDPHLTGPVGSGPIAVLGEDGMVPTAADVLAVVDNVIHSNP